MLLTDWVASERGLTTFDNVVDVISDGELFLNDVRVNLVSSDSQHGEFVELRGKAGRFYKKNYGLDVRSRE